MPAANPKVKIERLEPETVVAPLLVRTPFKIIGSGLSNKIYVYISTQPDGSDDVSNPTASDKKEIYKIKIDTDGSATSTDKVLSLVVKPELDAGPFDEKTEFWIAIKLDDMKGKVEATRKTFKLV
ncbi:MULTISPECIES: hypothetical protein [Rhizobium]|uniref:hypothetical protein n=1 Tax=Rhizobium TaxID=379 RepID=UPI001B34421A|nr:MULTISPECIES: hypothetical protein [Rhizobium]MBX4909457.1 hypothetical protein [Rhizobium bangladeshense]MBX5228446.1 hypothetical protein [Rhizobium sp. NLR9b]MBX5234707.1 hypothetical protein [Rhizobium sp. NLR4a]MBX5240390.1 hypothetical protein [Rhizobium sp. NLR22b]MBX5251960.1 hypothetical protein [Rhizobium sp. NLR4b]